MSAISLAGSGARNGLSERRDYVYQGSGEDILTPPVVLVQWMRQTPQPLQPCCGGTRPDHGRDCRRHMPKPRRQSAPKEGSRSADGRCDDCGYPVTAPGHKIECEGTP